MPHAAYNGNGRQLLLAILLILVGLWFVSRPWDAADVMIRIFGAALLAGGALALISASSSEVSKWMHKNGFPSSGPVDSSWRHLWASNAYY